MENPRCHIINCPARNYSVKMFSDTLTGTSINGRKNHFPTLPPSIQLCCVLDLPLPSQPKFCVSARLMFSFLSLSFLPWTCCFIMLYSRSSWKGWKNEMGLSSSRGLRRGERREQLLAVVVVLGFIRFHSSRHLFNGKRWRLISGWVLDKPTSYSHSSSSSSLFLVFL